jgi:hypothetical protein
MEIDIDIVWLLWQLTPLVWKCFPAIVFVILLVVFLPWPLISIALTINLFSTLLFEPQWIPDDTEIYLPRLPLEVFEHIASHLGLRSDLVRFSYASRSAHHASNPFLYRSIVLDEHPSANIPWFRRRLYRLHYCLSSSNALLVRHADFSYYEDIDQGYLFSLLVKCKRMTSLSLPAIQEPFRAIFGMRDISIPQPVFLSSALRIPIYSGITSFTWTGPFIPFRGSQEPAGREALRLFPQLRSLKIVYRADSYGLGHIPLKCINTYPLTLEAARNLKEDLSFIAQSCPLLEELILPFWEVPYSMVGKDGFKAFPTLRKVHFLAIDGPMKDVDYGLGFLKFAVDMRSVGIALSFENPWRRFLDVVSLLDEIDLNVDKEVLLSLPKENRVFGPTGPERSIWRGRSDILSRMEWACLGIAELDGQFTLRWPILSSRALSLRDPAFAIPTIFSGLEFVFDTRVPRGNPEAFLMFSRLIEEATQIPHIRHIRILLERIDGFYLVFPLFWQFKRNRRLTFCVERLLLSQTEGSHAVWLRRQWKVKRAQEIEIDVRLEDLGEYEIHVHPARLFEKIMLGLLFTGERNVGRLTCVFHDMYTGGRES